MTCTICERPSDGRTWWCCLCNRAYDRARLADGTLITVIEWAAKRARYFERRRWQQKLKSTRK